MSRGRFLLCALLAGCTYGGPSGDPLSGFAADDRGGQSDVASSPSVPSQSSSDEPDAKVRSSSGSDAGKSNSGKPGDAGSSGSGSSSGGSASAGNGGSADACAPAKAVATCDPVRNTGCPPLTQCDIDTSASEPTGRCVFYSNPDGGECTSSFVNVGCSAQSTCVAGMCRKMCYCDSDCPQGQACSDTSGPGPSGAFKLCI